MASKPKVGGTKDADVDTIRRLQPDLVVANVEENQRAAVDALRAAGIPVWVTFPRTVRDGIDLIREMGELTGTAAEAQALAAPLEAGHRDTIAASAGGATPVFCPIWRHPYMTVNRDTYVHDVLRVCGGANVFADRPTRYPVVTLEEVAAAAPEVILLPDEPFRFLPRHLRDFDAFPGIPAVAAGRIHFLDGKLVTWYGRRVGEALATLPGLLRGPRRDR